MTCECTPGEGCMREGGGCPSLGGAVFIAPAGPGLIETFWEFLSNPLLWIKRRMGVGSQWPDGWEDLGFITDDGEEEFPCKTCNGEGIGECHDTNSSEGCWEPNCGGDWHRCPNCKGSGNAKDMWFF